MAPQGNFQLLVAGQSSFRGVDIEYRVCFLKVRVRLLVQLQRVQGEPQMLEDLRH